MVGCINQQHVPANSAVMANLSTAVTEQTAPHALSRISRELSTEIDDGAAPLDAQVIRWWGNQPANDSRLSP